MTADAVVDRVVDVVVETAPEIREGLRGRRERVDADNPSGETQLAADVWADERFAERFADVDGVGTYGSEERETVVEYDQDGVSVALDPLDGSSNLKSNNAMGTVFGVYDSPLPASGRDLVAAGFVLYGPITTLVVARGDRVREYEVTDDGTRLLDDDLAVPHDPVVYGFGGRVPDWPDDFTAYAREVESELKLRYGGAMIGDVNQVLTYGGVFAYPGLQSRPEGKLRLQFECNPIAYVVEAAGGASSTGDGSVLDATPESLHQRVPLHVGNEPLVERLEAALD
jgi:fructose-1,6-bisphosphatase I